MESSSEGNGYNIDSTAGGLVWVRRRNGSWWPGRILCPDELPESCLVLHGRSGTPVKLLGRENASVDWYNLEKSKRVKAFRCGEYDECIEKAKANATIPCKKTGIYAHRAHAILQALELENSQLSKNNNPETTSQTGKNGHISDKLSGGDSISISPQELSRATTLGDNSEDDGIEGSMKRMRGLDDLGIERAISSFKRKRYQVVHIYNFPKKKSRRRQLTKVLKKTAVVSVPVMCEEVTGLNRLDNVMNSDSGANNCKQKDNENSINSELLDNDDSTGRLFDVPFIPEEIQTAGSSLVLVPKVGRVSSGPQSDQSSLIDTASVEPVELQESGSISSGVDINHILDNGTFKWQQKGKRNSRNKNKTKTVHQSLKESFTGNPKYQPLDVICRKPDTDSLYDVNIEVKTGHFLQHHPYISLLSKFTGQRVTGHSLEAEILKETVSDLSLNCSEYLSGNCELGGVNNVNNDINMVPEASKKQRKNGLLSTKKIRRLSLLTITKRSSETGHGLACVTLKVVFGRIHAALGISSADAATAW